MYKILLGLMVYYHHISDILLFERNKLMNHAKFNNSIQETISKLKKDIKRYNIIISTGNVIKIILSASIPILIHQASDHPSLLLTVSIASAIITIIQSTMSAFNFENKVQTATQILMKIENEKLLYLTRTKPYIKSDEDNFHLFILNLQDELNDIISDFNEVNN